MAENHETEWHGSNSAEYKTKGSAQNQDYKCPNCPKTCKGVSRYVRHLRSHLSYYTFECVDCCLCFNTKKCLLDHKKTHNGAKRFHCRRCSESFNHQFGLSKHLLTHAEEEPFKCFICGVEFRSFSDRNRHVKNHAISCGLCNARFRTEENLRDHLLTKHRSRRSEEVKSIFELDCEDDSFQGDVVGNQTGLTQNISHSSPSLKVEGGSTPANFESNVNVKEYICFICHEVVSSKTSLQLHLDTHSYFNCSFCTKFFAKDEHKVAHELSCLSNPDRVGDSVEESGDFEMDQVGTDDADLSSILENRNSSLYEQPSTDVRTAVVRASSSGDPVKSVTVSSLQNEVCVSYKLSENKLIESMHFSDDLDILKLDESEAPVVNFNLKLHMYWLKSFVDNVKVMFVPLSDPILKKTTHVKKLVMDVLFSEDSYAYDCSNLSFLWNILNDLNDVVNKHVNAVSGNLNALISAGYNTTL